MSSSGGILKPVAMGLVTITFTIPLFLSFIDKDLGAEASDLTTDVVGYQFGVFSKDAGDIGGNVESGAAAADAEDAEDGDGAQ